MLVEVSVGCASWLSNLSKFFKLNEVNEGPVFEAEPYFSIKIMSKLKRQPLMRLSYVVSFIC